MLTILYITLICYIPILDGYLPRTNFGRGIPDIGPELAISYILFLFFLLQYSIIKNIKILNQWIVLITIYSTVVLASVYWSALSYNGFTLQIIFNSIFLPLFIATLAIHLFRDPNNINTFIKHLAISGLILSLISIAQMISGVVVGKTAIRSTGTFSKPNGLAIYLVMIIPCVLNAMDNKLISRTAGRLVTLSMVGGILCTVSRKGIATMVLSFCIYNLLKKRYKQLAATLAGLFVLAVIVSGYSMISSRFQQSEVSHSMQGKMDLTHAGWEMFKTSPIIGLGFHGFKSHYNQYIQNTEKENYDAHNIFITLLSDYGLLGFIPFMGTLLYPLVISMRILRSISHNDHNNDNHITLSKDSAVICAAVIVPFIISGWFAGGLLFETKVMFLLYSNIAMVIACYNGDPP